MSVADTPSPRQSAPAPRWWVALKSLTHRRLVLTVAVPVLLVAGVLRRLFRGEGR